VATHLKEARELRGVDLKSAAKAVGVPQYRLRDIEESRLQNLNLSALEKYVDFLSLSKWFARWRKANSKLGARLAVKAGPKIK
jgi:hypothetical protein